MWIECNIGGGEEIRGYEDGGPPTLCQPASQQGGGEEDNILAGGAWRGLEVCWGFGSNFCECFQAKSLEGDFGKQLESVLGGELSSSWMTSS